MKSLRTGVLALLALGVTGANAGGLGDRGSIKDGPYQGVLSWTGFYVGVTAGAASGESRQGDITNAGRVDSNPFDVSGFTAGATLGYNFQTNTNWVVGIEVDISHAGISGSFSGNLGQPGGGTWHCTDPNGQLAVGPCETDVNWFGTVRGRIGYAFNTLLIYGTGGLAYGKVESGLKDHEIPSQSEHVSDINLGWTAGGGVEYAFAPNWSAKFEYLHVDLGWTDRTGHFRADAEFDLVRLGLNYRFGK